MKTTSVLRLFQYSEPSTALNYLEVLKLPVLAGELTCNEPACYRNWDNFQPDAEAQAVTK
jgi:hypothetical protein